MAAWQTLSSRIAYENPWIKIREDSVINPGGKEGVYGVLELQHDSVYIVPITAAGEFALTRQYRYPLQRDTWEFPCGQTDGEPALIAAKREMLEETGYSSDKLTFLSSIAADTGLCSTYAHVVLAENAVHTTDTLDENDGILEVRLFSAQEVNDMIIEGDIICPHSISSFYLAQNRP